MELEATTVKLSAEATKALESIKDYNEVEFLEQADHQPLVRQLLGMLLLMLGVEGKVYLSDPELSWVNVRAFLQERLVGGGLCNTE